MDNGRWDFKLDVNATDSELIIGLSKLPRYLSAIFLVVGAKRWSNNDMYYFKPVITWGPGPRLKIKTLFYQHRKSHCVDKMIWQPSYLHNGIPYTGKMTSLYWIGALCDKDVYPMLVISGWRRGGISGLWWEWSSHERDHRWKPLL